jgi:hypothetical protein
VLYRFPPTDFDVTKLIVLIARQGRYGRISKTGQARRRGTGILPIRAKLSEILARNTQILAIYSIKMTIFALF